MKKYIIRLNILYFYMILSTKKLLKMQNFGISI